MLPKVYSKQLPNRSLGNEITLFSSPIGIFLHLMDEGVGIRKRWKRSHIHKQFILYIETKAQSNAIFTQLCDTNRQERQNDRVHGLL